MFRYIVYNYSKCITTDITETAHFRITDSILFTLNYNASCQ